MRRFTNHGTIVPFICAVLMSVILQPYAAMAAPQVASILLPAPAGRASQLELASVCSRARVPCDVATTTAYVSANDPAGAMYLIDSTGPKLIRVGADRRTGRTSSETWDFGNYRHSFAAPSSEPLSIYPALYFSAGKTAAALISEVHEAYSGGGGVFSVADFVLLSSGDRSAEGEWSPLYSAVPFACGKTVRACFSEREYAKSPHCHQDLEGTLSVSSANVSDGTWRFTWKEVDWPAGVTAAHKRTTRRSFGLPKSRAAASPARLPAEVNFCGGPTG